MQQGNPGNEKKSTSLSQFNKVLAVVFILSLATNQFLILRLKNMFGMKNILTEMRPYIFTDDGSGTVLAGDLPKDALALAIHSGVPHGYGQEMGVSFDDVQRSINSMKQYDPDYGSKRIILSGEKLQRYIDIGTRISCEYCCGVASIVFRNGQAACGCAHSQAMRGLMAYLLKNHPDQYSNDQILWELARWKGRYFPKQMIKKMAQHLESGNYTADTAALVMGLDMPKYNSKSGNIPLPSNIQSAPDMVGGC